MDEVDLTAPAFWAAADRTGFGRDNLPYGVFSRDGAAPRVGVAVGDHVLDVSRLDVPYAEDLTAASLNPLLARGRAAWTALRRRVDELLDDPATAAHLFPLSTVELQLPVTVADYVDFYSSEHHATNVGRILRPGGDPLAANWRHIPIGYHGRAGTVVVSGTPVVRPCGQRREPGEDQPSYGPSRRLDIECEVGFVVGPGTSLGQRVGVDDAEEHVFGVVLLNDWSARDIQAWETVPLGPFLGKSFATSISAWVVPLEALDAARVVPPPQDPPPLEYLRARQPWGLDLALEVEWNATVVSRPPFAQMYWTPAQQLAHLTVNGASLRPGDLYGSGTVSGPEVAQRGSFLELTWNGTEPVTLADGSQRGFLADGDTVVLRGSAVGRGGGRISFGEVRGTIAPAV